MRAAALGRKASPETRAKQSAKLRERGRLPLASYKKGAATRAWKVATLYRGSAWVLHG